MSLFLSIAFLTSSGLGAPAPHAPAGERIGWLEDYEAALARAQSERKPLFLAVLDGSQESERIAQGVHRDPGVVALAARTLPLVAWGVEHSAGARCPRLGNLPCSAHRSVDALVRSQLLRSDAQGFAIAPQHLLLGPDGQVLLAVPHEIDAPELEWCLARALRLVDPTAEVTTSPQARAPRALLLGELPEPGGARGLAPPTREETQELIKELKKGSGRVGDQELRRLLLSEEPEAMSYVNSLLRGGAGGGARGGGMGAGLGQGARQPRILRWIGASSPRGWWELAAEHAVGGREDLRREAVVALEQLGAPESVKRLQEGLRKEKDPAIRKDLLRALASAGGGSAGTFDTLWRAAQREKDPVLRVNAIVALGWLPMDARVEAALQSLLLLPEAERAERRRERLAALCAVGLSREERWIEPVLAVLREAQESRDLALERTAEAALGVLRRGGIAPLREPLREVCEDEIERPRFFGGSRP